VRGEFLRSLRKLRGWTQAEAAARADLTDRVIRKAEGGGPLEAKTVAQLALLYSGENQRLEPEDLLLDATAAAESKSGLSLEARFRKWFESCWVQFNLDVIEELSVPEIVIRTESGTVRGHAEIRAWMLDMHKSFSDFDYSLEEVLDLGATVAARWKLASTHTGQWLDLPPTGRRIVVHGVSWVELVGDKFANAWDFWDPGLIYEQLAVASHS
jgi:predicted ester cyclase